MQGKAGGRRQADQGLDAGTQYFLDQLQAAAAGDDGQATLGVDALPQQGADQFVEGVVPADVFAAEQQFAVAVHEQRRMHRAAVLAEGLEGIDALTQADQPLRRWQGCARQLGQLWQCLLQRFDPAQAATTGAGQLAALVFQVPERTAGNLQVGIHCRAAAGEFQVVDFRGAFHYAAADTEADGEVFQVGGADQHHRLVQAVVDNGQGHFFGQGRAVASGVIELDVIVGVAGGGHGQGR
ncbi:hypothetical protein D3C76_1083990 [compost metagenome]